MYEVYYNKVKKKCKNSTLLFTDTDSLCFETKEKSFEIMYDKDSFDLSNFPKDSKYYCIDNKKVPGKMKNEYERTAIYEFVGPKPKMYSIVDVNNCEKSVYKGHNSNIGHGEFIDVHSNKKFIRHNMKEIKPFNHIMYTYESNKISFSTFDDKRYILADRINTSPYGHKEIIRN